MTQTLFSQPVAASAAFFTPTGKVNTTMEMEHETEALAASFDLVARQDEAEKAITVLRSDVDEVKARLDRVSRAAARPALAEAAREPTPEVKGFVDGYLRKGRETEIKSISGVVPQDGGYAVPREIDALIARELKEISPIRQLAQVVQTGTSGYRKLVTTGGFASGWVGETATRPETATPTFEEIAPPSGDLYANPAASQAMLDDAAFDVEGWLASEIAMEFARAEGAAFVNGTGISQPLGFLASPVSALGDGARAFGALQYVGSGDADGFDAAPDAKLIDLVHTMKAGHRQGATWVMNSSTLAVVRKLKTPDGALLWQPGLVEGQPDRLLGYPVVEAEDMPGMAAGAFPIAFGNFKAGYLIAERSATQILRDPFTNKPFVHFYATRRVGGKVLDSSAIKLLKIEV
jgi:HK97 family phage major capsid protein